MPASQQRVLCLRRLLLVWTLALHLLQLRLLLLRFQADQLCQLLSVQQRQLQLHLV
jgi:hypothetical protein